jgi:hypothetical protein
VLKRAKSNGPLQTFDVEHARHALNGSNHPVEVLDVEDLDRYLDMSALV